MKITFLSPPSDLSGGQRVIATHADQLLARGHEVTVVTRRRDVPSLSRKLRDLALGQELAPPPRETHFDRMRAALVVLPHAGPITADDVPDADFVIATWWETAFEAVHFPPSKGHKIYFIQGYEIFSNLPSHISGASYLLPFKKITIASWLSRKMNDIYRDDNVSLVPNAVDHSLFFAPIRSRQPVPTVGFVYSAAYFKGVDIALSAIELVRKVFPALRVIVFGAKSPIKELSLPKGATFHLSPPQSRLKEIYSTCDVFIVPSRSEGFGLPILEAMACRTPIVASRTGCAEDVIEDGKNGYVVDIEDHKALADRLIRVLSMDNASWQMMSEQAYRTVSDYTWDDAGGLFEKILLDYMENDPGTMKRSAKRGSTIRDAGAI